MFWAAPNLLAQAAVSSTPLQQTLSLSWRVPRFSPPWKAPVPSRKVLQSPHGFWGLVSRSKPSQVASQRAFYPMVRGWGLRCFPGSTSLCVRGDFHTPQLLGAREGTLQQCEWKGRAWWWSEREDVKSLLFKSRPKTSVSDTQAGSSSLCRQPPVSQQALGHPALLKPMSLVPTTALPLPGPVLLIAAHPCVGSLLLRADLFSLETSPRLQPVPPRSSYSPAKQ